MLVASQPVFAGFGQADSAQIQELQKALKGLAQSAGKSEWDPGPITGTVTDQLLVALAGALPTIAAKAPGLSSIAGLATVLKFALLSPDGKAQAAQQVTQYAPQLTQAIRATTTAGLLTSAKPPTTGTTKAPTVPSSLLPFQQKLSPMGKALTVKPAPAASSSVPWYKRPMTYVVAGGVVLAVGAGYFLLRD